MEETSDGWVRATVTARDYLDREVAGSVSLTNHDTLASTTIYHPITGLVAASTANGVTEESTYDSWGRVLTATDGTGNTATTTYDSAGRVKTFDDGKGTYAYTYDGTDVMGRTERRGLTTKVDLGYASGAVDEVRGAYDRGGSLVRQDLPDGHQMNWTRNVAGSVTVLTYTRAGAPVASFAQTYDHLGRVRTAMGPAGSRTYRYDDRARLVQVDDQVAGVGCTIRKYAFTGDSNRTKLIHYGPDGDGGCQSSTVATTETYVYDQADRITGTGYSYDRMGRTLTMPAGHTDQAGETGATNLDIGYHANDMVHSLEQAVPAAAGSLVKKQSFTLDASDRISQTVTRTHGVALMESLNHYDGDSDSPAWTQTMVRPDSSAEFTTSWNRYVSDLAGGLAFDVDDNGAIVLQIANLHGDIVATAPLGQAGVTYYAETDEYGVPQTTGIAGPRYGWLGTHQRDGATLGGLVLMGARLYASSTGRFLSVDPVSGGGENRYTYPVDPVNRLDLDGEVDWGLVLEVGLTVAMLIPGAGAAVGAARLVMWGVRAVRVFRSVKWVNAVGSTAAKARGLRAAVWATRNAKRARYVARTFSRGTHRSGSSSFAYHYAKHGVRGATTRSPQRYAASARYHLRKSPVGKVRGRGVVVQRAAGKRWATYW